MPRYEEFVKNEWRGLEVEGWKGFILKEKIKNIKSKLRVWNKEHFGNLDVQIQESKDEIDKIDLRGESGVLTEEEIKETRICVSRVHSLSSRKYSFLWQQSRFRWLREGDANSKFFHRCIKKRRKVNEILGLNFEGSSVKEVDPLKSKIKGHFEQHFMRREGVRVIFDDLRVAVLDESESNLLVEPFSEEEIKTAVWNCNDSKSPGSDEVSFSFIKQFWEDVNEDFIGFMEEFHLNGRLVKGSNSSFIVLNPKKENRQKIGDFRPISLIGCMYKVLSKVLANCLRRVIHRLISKCQSAFIKGRQILEGVLIANEVLDDAKRRKKEALFFKVDFEKVYDSVNWDFLDLMM